MWRESKNTDMQSGKIRFYNAEDALRTYIEYQTTMNSPSAYDYSEALVSDTTGQTFGMDEYLTLKSVLQEAAKDLQYDCWVLLIQNVIDEKSIRSLEAQTPGAKKRIAVAKRMVEGALRKRDMLVPKNCEATAAAR